MGIILWILKIIGILLAIILGVILAVLLIVLLVPVRYRLKGARSPGDGVITARGKVSWLASILSVTFGYDQEFTWKIRIFGIPLKLKAKEAADADNEEAIEALAAELSEADVTEPRTEIPAENNAQDVRVTAEKEAGPLEKPVVLQTQEVSTAQSTELSTTEPTEGEKIHGEAETTSEKVPLKDKLRALWQKLTELLRSLLEKIRSIREKIASIPEKVRSIKQQADTWIQFATSDEVKQLLRSCWKQIKQILRHFLPTKLRVKGHYGFADPATTGQVTGILCMLPEKYQKSMDLTPDFNNVCLDGEFFLKGRIRLGSLLLPVIKILLNSNTWKVYKRFQSIQNNTNKTGPASQGDTRSKSKKTASTKKNSTKNDPHKGGKQNG